MSKAIKYLSLFFLCFSVYSQNFNWDKIALGLSSQYSISSGDLKQFWGNNFSGGLIADYNLSEDVALELSFLFSINNSINEEKYPNTLLIEIPAGVKYNYLNQDNLKLFVQTGLQNSTFIFSGKSAELVKENNIESEMGIFLTTGVHIKISDKIKCELFGKALNIFSKPEELRIISVGLNVFIL